MNLRSIAVKVGIPAAAIGSSFGAFAADYGEQINSAVTDASGNQTLVVGGVITIAVIGFGVGALLFFLRR